MQTLLIIVGICVAIAIAYYLWNDRGGYKSYAGSNASASAKECIGNCHRALDQCLDTQGVEATDNCVNKFIVCKYHCR